MQSIYILSIVADLNSKVRVHGPFNFVFLISCVMTLIALFCLGAIKSKFTDEHWLKGGGSTFVLFSSCFFTRFLLAVFLSLSAVTTAYGALAATVSFGIGFVLEFLLT